MQQKQLSGEVEDSEVGVGDCPQCTRIRREMAGLEQELKECKEKARLTDLKSAKAFRVVDVMRQQLEPWHNAMRLLFDEIDSVPSADGGHALTPDWSGGGQDRRWLAWQPKLPPKEWELVASLLEHGGMTRPQLAGALHCHPDTVSAVFGRLNKKGLVAKRGDKYYLREL